MLLTLTTTHRPATDLGFLLRKNPARPQVSTLSFGKAHVFYPEASEERCTVALLVEVDPVGLVRNRRGPSGEGGALEQYVNDRPYAASSFLSVAIADVFGTALAGNSKERPELVDVAMPFHVSFSALPCRGGEPVLRSLFEPLGYRITASRLPLDASFPEWGESAYYQVELEASLPLKRLLSHLYVLVPVLDNDKHYWVTDDEVQKLMRHGEGWLSEHPERESITRRYLKVAALNEKEAFHYTARFFSKTVLKSLLVHEADVVSARGPLLAGVYYLSVSFLYPRRKAK
jgi:3' terminal RNA ribose 2'-O-methyltransferase Hen1